VRTIRLGSPGRASPANQINYDLLIGNGHQVDELKTLDPLNIGIQDVIIDALLGIGINKPISGWFAQVIKQINSARRPVISIDLPSGLFANADPTKDLNAIIRATLTLTFEVPKLALLLPENSRFTGKWEIIPIDLDQALIHAQRKDHFLIHENDIVELLPSRPINGHKGTFGHALVIAGSTGKMGAAVLAVKACSRSGVGLITASVPKHAFAILQSTVPEAMCVGVDDDHTSLPELDQYSSIGIGPGIGKEDDIARIVKLLIRSTSSNLVMDADALNILSENRTWLAFLPKNTILTPHPKEFERLYGSPSINDQERLSRAREFAIKHQCIVILKSSITAVCDTSGKVYFNSTGNPGMAKGGSGDALTGLITGLLAQRMAPLKAAIIGVHLHGVAGDITAAEMGMDGMTVSDLIDRIPKAWQQLRAGSK
ncbi:MAG: NAD(P)H-hydrate dehydratase, partial [Bacteroidota bacterium]|nr:NAD(P)H-hydrate dehydratase [Bacteroidota bacterium]